MDDYRVYDVDGGYSDYYGTSYYDERSVVWLDYHTVTPPPSTAVLVESYLSTTNPAAPQYSPTSTVHWPAHARGTPPTLPSNTAARQQQYDLITTTFKPLSSVVPDGLVATTLQPTLRWNLFTILNSTTTTLLSAWQDSSTTTTALNFGNFSVIPTDDVVSAATAATFLPSHPTPYPIPIIVVICLFLGLISLATAVGNVFVISAILTEKSLQSVANYLIMSLAVSDFLVATTVMPFALALEAMRGQWIFGAYACDLWTIFDVLCCTASILHLVAIAIDRFWAITSVQYIQNRTSKRIGLMLLIVWIVVSTIAILPMVFFKDSQEFALRIAQNECSISDSKAFRVGGGLIAFWMPLIAILLIYWKIWKAAKSRIRKKDFKVHGPGAVDREKLPLRQRFLARFRRHSNLSVSSLPDVSSSTPNPPSIAGGGVNAQQHFSSNHHSSHTLGVSLPGGNNTFNSLAATQGFSQDSRYRHSRVSDALLASTISNNLTAPASSSSDASARSSSLVPNNITILPPSQSFGNHHIETDTQQQQQQAGRQSTPAHDWISRSSSLEDQPEFRKAMQQQPVLVKTCRMEPANGSAKKCSATNSPSNHDNFFTVNTALVSVVRNEVKFKTCEALDTATVTIKRPFLSTESISSNNNDSRMASSPLIVNELTPACIRKKQPQKPSLTALSSSGAQMTLATVSDPALSETNKNHAHNVGDGKLVCNNTAVGDEQAAIKIGDYGKGTSITTTATTGSTAAKTPSIAPSPRKRSNASIASSVIGGQAGGSSKLTPNHQTPKKPSGKAPKRNSNNTSGSVAGGRKNDKEYQAKQKEKKAAKTLAIITLSFCLCWIGFFSLQLIEPFCGEDGCQWSSPILFSVFNWLGYSNSMLNPILYTIFSPDFRRAFKRILLGRKAVQQQSRLRR